MYEALRNAAGAAARTGKIKGVAGGIADYA
jgi:hypothetical protein